MKNIRITRSLRCLAAVGLIPAALIALLVFVPVVLPASPASALKLPPGFTQQGPGQSCGAGTFAVYGVCAPCRYNPALCSPPAPKPVSPKATEKTDKGAKNSGDKKVSVNTINKKEAPGYGLGVKKPAGETHPACRVSGGPAYTFTPSQAAAGRCSSSANKYYDPNAACPAGTHRRARGASGQYWCDSNRQDYSINDRVKGHTVCMRGAIAILSSGACLYCSATGASGGALRRSASVQSGSCSYASAPPTTVRVTVPVTRKPVSPVTAAPSTAPPAVPPTAPSTAPPYIPPYIPPTAAPPPSSPPPPGAVGPPELPRVSLGWSPSVAVTQLPVYLWLKDAQGKTFKNPPAVTWRDSQGRTYLTTMSVTSSVWAFEIVDGSGKAKTEKITCSGIGTPWRPAWTDANGQPTAAARSEGACWYIYRHMGDGSARSVNTTINWSVRTCQTLPAPKPCTVSTRTNSFASTIAVTEIQALVA